MAIHRVEAGSIRVMAWCGGAFALFAILGAAAVFMGKGPLDSERLTLLAFAVIAAAAAAWCFRFAIRRHDYEVETTPDQIRVGRRRVPWSGIASIRARSLLHRLDLLDVENRTLAAVEYEVEGFDEVMEEITQRIPPRVPAGKRVFGERRSTASIVVNAGFLALTCGAAAYFWWHSRHWIAVVLPPLVAWGLYSELRNDLRQLEVRDHELVLRTFLREHSIEIPRISRSRLTLDWTRNVSCAIELRDGRLVFVTPREVDPIELHELLHRQLARS